MRIAKRRDETEAESPFRTPEQLALAMPLIAVIGLMVVVCAVVTGGSGPVVALVSVGGFGLCAIAPMALIEVYVTRPLRSALAQMRAARDGRADKGAAFHSGVVADLVHLARDIQAAQASLDQHGDAIENCEKMVAAGDEAVRAFRLHTEDLVEAAASGDGRLNRSVGAQIAELAVAVKSLRHAPPASLDGAVERLESMLVYIAETQERMEARDRHIEGGVGQVELGVADLARVVAREAETVRANLSGGGLTARTEIAALVAGDKVGRERVLDRIDALETRLGAKLAAAPALDARQIARAIHAEALADGRAQREAAVAAKLASAAADFAPLVEAVLRLTQDLAPAALVEALRDSSESATQATRAQLDALAANLSQLSQDFARAPAEPETIVEALRGELNSLAEGFARLDASRPQTGEPSAELQALMMTLAQDRASATTSAAELQTLAADISQKLDEVVAASRTQTEPVAALGEQLREQGEGQSRRIDEMESRVVAKFVALGRDADTSTLTALARAAKQIGEAANWLDAMGVRPAPDTGDRPDEALLERLSGDLQGVAAALDALSGLARENFDAASRQLVEAETRLAGEALEPLRLSLEEGQARLAEMATRIGAQGERLDAFEAQALAPACEALAGASREFAAAQVRIEQAAERIEAGDPRLAEVAGLNESVTRLSELAASAQSRDVTLLDPARAALADAAARFDVAQTRLEVAAAQIEAVAPVLAQASGQIGRELTAMAASVSLQTDALGQAASTFESAQSRFEGEAVAGLRQDVAALQASFETATQDAEARLASLGLDHLPEVVSELKVTQARWRDLVESLVVDAQKLTALAETDTRDIDALRADFASAGANVCAAVAAFAARFDAEAETQVERLTQVVVAQSDGAVAAIAARVDAQAQAQVERLGQTLEMQSREVVATFAARFDAQAETQIARMTLAVASQSREALAALGQGMSGLADAQGRLEAAFADDAPAAALQQGLEALRADFAGAAERFDGAALALTTSVEARVETLRGGELGPAVTRAQATAKDLGATQASLLVHIETLQAALATDRAAVSALRQDVVEGFATMAAFGERTDAAIGDAAAKAEALTSTLSELGRSERAELARVTQTLAATGARVEGAAKVFEDQRGGLDLPTLSADLTRDIDALGRATAQRVLALESGVLELSREAASALGTIRATAQALDVAEIAGRFEAFARTQETGLRAQETGLRAQENGLRAQENGLRALENRLLAPAHDLVARLEDAIARRGTLVVEAVEENSARLDALARLQDERLEGLERLLANSPTQGEAPTGDLRDAAAMLASATERLQALAQADMRLDAVLQAAEKRPIAEPPGLAARSRTALLEPKTSGAVAKLVVSMADALDFRFSHIEAALVELTDRLQAPQELGADQTMEADIAELAAQLQSASQALKSGLAEFVGASAALADDVARSRDAQASPQAARADG